MLKSLTAFASALLFGASASAAGPAPRPVSDIASQGINTGDPRDGMWAAMSGRLGIADVKALRRDVRRAMAAYPDIPADTLTEGRWFGFKPMTVPASYGGWNATTTQDSRTKEWFLDSAYMNVVRPEYNRRATDAEAEAYFAAKKISDRAARLARLRTSGYFTAWSGSGGSYSATCSLEKGCVVEIAREWASTGSRWTFPFVPEEWLDSTPSSRADLEKLPSFRAAKHEEVAVTPSGVTTTIGPA